MCAPEVFSLGVHWYGGCVDLHISGESDLRTKLLMPRVGGLFDGALAIIR